MRITAPVTDYIPKSILTTTGDLAVHGAAIPERLAGGALDTYFKGQGAGVLPIYENLSLWDIPFSSGTFNRSTAGIESLRYIGYRPSIVFFGFCDIVPGNANWGFGMENPSYRWAVVQLDNGISASSYTTFSIVVRRSTVNYLTGEILSWYSDGFEITFTLVGATGATIVWVALP